MSLKSATPSRELIETLGSALAELPEVAAGYLYGSAAHGRRTSLSDVDVAVLFRSTALTPEDRRTALGAVLRCLSRSFPGESFDIRDADALPLSVRGRVVSEGIRVFDGDPPRRVAFEVHTRMRFFDFLPFQTADTQVGLRALRERLTRG